MKNFLKQKLLGWIIFWLGLILSIVWIWIIYASWSWYSDLPAATVWSWLTANAWNNLVWMVNKSVKQDSEIITVDNANQRIGIGTNVPTTKLEVNWDIKANNIQWKLNWLKMYAWNTVFAVWSCDSVATPCVINISWWLFTTAPICTISIWAIDASWRSENMIIKSITSTTLNIWKGNYQNEGTTMNVYWICIWG